MIGYPKYNYGDIVTFTFNGKQLNGSIYIIDKYGTFEDSSEVSYDIMTKNCLYKHIREDLIGECIMTNPIIDNRIVISIYFATNLKTFLETTNTDNPDNEKMREHLLNAAESLLDYQKYTCVDSREQKFLSD